MCTCVLVRARSSVPLREHSHLVLHSRACTFSRATRRPSIGRALANSFLETVPEPSSLCREKGPRAGKVRDKVV